MSVRRGRSLAVAAAIVLLIVVVGLAAVAVAPTVLVLSGLGVLGLVGALASRLRQPSRHRTRSAGHARASEPPRPDRDTWPTPPWIRQWQSTPPPNAVGIAREHLTPVLAEWDLGGEAGEPTLLVVTELLSNAIDHAQAPITLTVSSSGESVRVEVHDSAPGPPQLQPFNPLARRGRGLQVVEALSTRWGWTEERVGKTVWADVLTGWPSESSGASA